MVKRYSLSGRSDISGALVLHKDYVQLQDKNEKLKENQLDILIRVQYVLEHLGPKSTLFLIEQALKGE